jgi:hypothetical protein
MPTMAASTGQSFIPDAIRAELIAFRFAVGIHWARDEQLAADEPRILPRRDNSTDDAGKDHG